MAVRWARDSAGQFHLQVTAPAGTSGQVWVPLASTSATSTAITSGATFVQRNGLFDIYSAGPGTSEFSSTT
ncbi:alpha-L-rhamnosidase C-terminal domain-containing protein [Actinoplanes sp. NPDC026623]|uniref:alpha-L-rhamnosidase C-terminal domain-containing protein n=1 Tax=Actinoplanes sp. NPDC026623 TaxID=3155610 RepID=UPI00340449DA